MASTNSYRVELVRVWVAVALIAVVAGCASSNPPRSPAFKSNSTNYTGPAPTSTTSADAFTRIYLTAAQRGDCDFLRRYTDTKLIVSTFCADPKVRQFRSIQAPVFVPASIAGVDEQDVQFQMNTGGSSDGTIPRGWYGWGISLVRSKTGWRVHDDGTG